jgi:hypothetical protein
MDSELETFINGKLSGKWTEKELNEACIKFVKTKSYKAPDQAAIYGGYLVIQIYDWGFYPTDLIAYLGVFKAKLKFEEIAKRDLTERLVGVLVNLANENIADRKNALFLKLIGYQKFQNIKSKKLLDSIIQLCLNLLGQYIQIDKLVYIILTKLSLKISDDIREFKVIIAEKIFSMVFMLFSKIYSPGFLQQKETVKTYLYYLKLLVTFGKEVTDIFLSSVIVYSKTISNPKDEKADHFSCLMRLLVFNLYFYVGKSNTIEFYRADESFFNLIGNKTFKMRVKEMFDYPYSDYNNCLEVWYADKDMECDQYAKSYDSETEIVEKIKSNSIKLLTVFVRNVPDLFMMPQNMPYIIPEKISSIKINLLCKQRCYLASSIFTKQMMQFFRGRSDENLMIECLYNSLEDLVESDYLSTQKHLTLQELTQMEKQCYEILSKQGLNSINLVIALLLESKTEIKLAIIELLNIFQDVVHKRLIAVKPSKSKELTPDVLKTNSIAKLGESSRALFFLFILELYLTKSANMKFILEGLSQCSIGAMISFLEKDMIKNIIDYFMIPVLASSTIINYEFLPEFEKFLINTFEAGFSEYFISKIDYLKEIILNNLSWVSRQRKPTPATIAKLKMYLSLVDKLLSNHSEHMIDCLPELTHFHVDILLKNESYSQLHHMVPMFFAKLLRIQSRTFTEGIFGSRNRSFSMNDYEYLRPVRTSEEPQLRESVQAPKSENVKSLTRSDINIPSTSKQSRHKYLDMDSLVKKTYSRLFVFSASQDFNDIYENEFIQAFILIPCRLIHYINLELQQENHLDIEDCLMTIMNKMRSKKNKLILVDYVLSNQHWQMFQIRYRMWMNLFELFNDKVLSVEIVFTNYNIIYGLRNFQKIINERYIVKIFYQTVSSMRSKNRKLINNCLKIFGYVLAHYSFSILGWILDLEVPNVFADELEGEKDDRETISSLEFLEIAFRKFIVHKYSKFNIIAMSSLAMILKRHEGRPEPVSKVFTEMVDKLSSTVFKKLQNSESYKMKQCSLEFLLRNSALRRLRAEELEELLNFVFSLVEGTQSSTSQEEQDPIEAATKKLMENDSLKDLIFIDKFLISLEQKIQTTEHIVMKEVTPTDKVQSDKESDSDDEPEEMITNHVNTRKKSFRPFNEPFAHHTCEPIDSEKLYSIMRSNIRSILKRTILKLQQDLTKLSTEVETEDCTGPSKQQYIFKDLQTLFPEFDSVLTLLQKLHTLGIPSTDISYSLEKSEENRKDSQNKLSKVESFEMLAVLQQRSYLPNGDAIFSTELEQFLNC